MLRTFGESRGFRTIIVGFLAGVATLALAVDAVDAKGRKRHAAKKGGGYSTCCSNSSRQARSRRTLRLEKHVVEASASRTAPVIAEARKGEGASAPVVVASAGGDVPPTASPASAAMPMPATPINRGPSEASAPAAAAPSRKTAGGAIDPIKPIAVRTIKVKLNGVQTASLTPPLAHLPLVAVKDNVTTKAIAASPAEPAAEPASAKPAVQTASVKPAAAPIPAAPAAPSSPEPSHPAAAAPAPAPIQVASAGPTIPVAAPAPAPIQVASAVPTISAAAAAPAEAAAPSAPRKVHTGWIIQVGAFEAEREAKDRLSSAQSKAKHLLARADAFTETVVKDNRTFFRARFAGFEKDEAEAACKYLKRNDFACMTLKN